MIPKQLSSEGMEPADLELGDDVTDQFVVRRPMGVVLSVALTQDEANQLAAIAQQEGISLLDLARRSLLAALGQGTTPADTGHISSNQ